MSLTISDQTIPTALCRHNEPSDDGTNSVVVPQLSLAGCGFLCIYHAGVCAAIKEYAPHLTRHRVKGSSAGAIAAAGLICDVCISQATSTILQVVTEARAGSLQALSPNFNIIGLLRKGLEQSFPANAHILCSGRLFISATRARDYKNVIISEFDSREELIQAIICSCFIPFYCGLSAPYYRGEQYIDGGFSDNQPGKFESGTITISPFSGESDICPSDEDSASMFAFNFYGTPIQLTTQNLFRMVVTLFPPSPEVCSRICRQGFEDTLRFLTKNCMAPCVKCLTVQSNAIPVTNQQQQNVKPFRPTECNKLQKDKLKWTKSAPSASRMKNLQNECHRCFEPVDLFEAQRFSSVPMPNTVQKSLAEMEARHCTWMNYLRRQRIFRWCFRLLIPVILPCELVQFSVNKIRDWLSSVASSEQCLARLQDVADFFLAEIESRQLLHTPSAHFASGVLPVGPISSFKIASSDVLPSAVLPSFAFPQRQPMEMSSAILMERRKSSVAPLDLATSRSLAEAKEDEEQITQREDEAEQNSLQLLGDYCCRHDAILAFHYMDDATNQLKMCQIFDAQGRNPRKDSESHAPVSTTYFANDSVDKAEPKECGEDDSGLSLTEEEEKLPERQRKKGICSAIPTSMAKSFAYRRKGAAPSIGSDGPRHLSSHNLATSSTAQATFAVPRRHTFSTQRAPSLSLANSRIPFAPRKHSAAMPDQSKGRGKNGTDSEQKTAAVEEEADRSKTVEVAIGRGGIPQLIKRKTATTRHPPGALGGARRGYSFDYGTKR